MAYALIWSLLLGGYYAIALPQYLRAVESASWPTAEGVMVRSQVQQYQQRGSMRDRLDIEYRYVVAGEEYASTRVSWGGENIQRVLAEYPVGRKVEVYYKPDAPGDSLLVPGLHREQRAAWVFGTVALVLVYSVGLFAIYCPAAWARMCSPILGRA